MRRDTPDSIFHALAERSAAAGDPRLVVTFPIAVPANFTEEEVRGFLEQQGYTRVHAEENAVPRRRAGEEGQGKGKAGAEARRILHVVQDRFRFSGAERERVMEALDTALRMGAGHLAVHVMDDEGRDAQVWKYSDRLHCADCDIEYTDPLPSSFVQFAAGRLRILPWLRPRHRHRLRPGDPGRDQDPARRRHQALDHAVLQGMPGRPAEVRAARRRAAGRALEGHEARAQALVLHGTPDWKGGNDAWKHQWYGVQRFFDWLETKAYKMHVRVLLSKYRSYTPCPACNGARA